MAVDVIPTRPRPARSETPLRAVGLRLLDAVPPMREAVPPEDRELADRVLFAPTDSFEPGPVVLPQRHGPEHPFAVVIVSGTVLRETSLGQRAVTELLGPGDVIDTYGDDDNCPLPAQTAYLAKEPTTVAVLDDRFAVAARRWPALYQVLGAQQARQVRRASRHLATLGLPRVEDRIVALFCDLADRWGRVTPHGIRIDVPPTHALIGQLVGARRPAVSLALTDLAGTGKLRRDEDRSWLLAHDVRVAA